MISAVKPRSSPFFGLEGESCYIAVSDSPALSVALWFSYSTLPSCRSEPLL